MYLSEGKTPLVEGTIIGVNELIVSNDSKVEIKDNIGLMFRLGENSEFSLELTALGIAPVFYGEVYKGRLGGHPIVMCGGKYRTSCYVQCLTTMFFENLESDLDAFYALSDEVEVWEYDERGRRFPIVTLEEGYKANIRYLEDKPMRERYVVESIEPITDDKYDYITSKFMNPKNWR
ncbi:hypothetical protein [Fervidibacillus halotolerans]|uniref:Uncharacterized protein n=1 Tax=Fervidibacillus halotolerans TaxID=2980027 RepID=A0A9E8M1W4_9BACI|nr:hypothetical protein [Fervidibacillus halotolerans]WAA12911.1 hypothetical protein OE105_01840 [Fervidibacillus halotolerans]